MPLVPRKAEIPLFGGLAQDIAEEVVEQPSMLVMENVRYDKEGRARRRWGYQELNPAILGGSNLTVVETLLTRDNKELAACNQTHLYSRTEEGDDGAGKWRLVDRMPPIVGLKREVVSAEYGSADVYDVSVAYSDSGYIGVSYSYESTTGFKVGAVIIDQRRGQVVSLQAEMRASDSHTPKIIATTNEFIVSYTDGASDIILRRFAISTMTWGAESTPVTNAVAGNYDIHELAGQSVFFIANRRTAGQLDIRRFNSSTLANTHNALDARGGGKSIFKPTLTPNGSVLFCGFYNDTDDTIECLGLSTTDLSATFAAAVLATGITLSPINTTSVFRGTSAWVVWDIAQVGTPPTAVQRMEWRGISAAGAVDANGPWRLQNYVLLSRPITLSDGRSYLVGGIRSNQNTQFGCVLVDIGEAANDWNTNADNLLSYRGRPCGKWMTADLNQHANGVLSAFVQGPTVLNEIGLPIGIEIYVAFGKKDLTVSGFGRGSAAELTTMTTSSLDRWSATAQVGSDLYIPAALPHIYDGDKVFEAGFCYFPWAETTGLAAGGTLAVDSQYEYRFVYEWMDRQGRVWRSQPSVFSPPASPGTPGQVGVGTAVTNAVGNLRTVEIRVPHYSLTSTRDPEKNYRSVSIVAYRRNVTAGETSFVRLLKSGNLFDQNNTASGTYLLFSDNGGNYGTTNQPVLYTDGDVQENFPPRPSVHACVWDSRIFQACSDDPRTIRFSAELIDFEGARWHEDNFIVTPDDGPVIAVLPLNESLIILKRRSIYWIQGQGPDDTGNNGAYTQPSKITSVSGCINTRSLVLTPNGIFFQSERGFELLRPDRSVISVAKVEDILDDNQLITSAAVSVVDSEVRWTVLNTQSGESPPNGGIIKYNYEFDRWSYDKLFSNNFEATSAIYVDGKYYFGVFTGEVVVEDRSEALNSFSDREWLSTVHFIPYTIKTPNIKLDGLQGFKRLWRVTLMGKMLYAAPADSPGVNLTMSTDYTDNLDFSISYPLTDIIAQANPPIVQLRMIPKHQQLSAFSISITETIPSGTSSDQHNAGIAWTSVMLEYGVEPKAHGRFKGAANK